MREQIRCNIFLGYTSNLVSSGLREVIRFLVQHNYVQCLVTTAGGIEEDLIKCLGPTFVTPGGEFNLNGADLRRRGLNRIGNLLVPNDNYCKFEDWVVPILDKMVDEQENGSGAKGSERTRWTPSKVIERLGHEINDESSILYWAAKVSVRIRNLAFDRRERSANTARPREEQNSSLLSRSHGRFTRRHDVLSHM